MMTTKMGMKVVTASDIAYSLEDFFWLRIAETLRYAYNKQDFIRNEEVDIY